jgi:hypothetical protein
LYNETGQFERFLANTVEGPYMDMLYNAGYGVGRGTVTQGRIDEAALSQVISDGQIQNQLVSLINHGQVSAPNSERLYMVYVEPNVEVTNSSGNSVNNFAGYHSSFNMTYGGQTTTIHYAVIPTPGGTVKNASANPYLTTFNEMTLAASHELAEAVTDPNPMRGWVDPYNGEEIGDLAAGYGVTLNGYEVQEVGNKFGQRIAPAGWTNQIAP